MRTRVSYVSVGIYIFCFFFFCIFVCYSHSNEENCIPCIIMFECSSSFLPLPVRIHIIQIYIYVYTRTMYLIVCVCYIRVNILYIIPIKNCYLRHVYNSAATLSIVLTHNNIIIIYTRTYYSVCVCDPKRSYYNIWLETYIIILYYSVPDFVS